MFFMKFCACLLVWMCILAYLGGIGVIVYFSYERANVYKNSTISGDTAVTDEEKNESWTTDENTMRWIFYISSGVFILSVLILICYCKTIRLTIAIMEAASDFVRDVACA